MNPSATKFAGLRIEGWRQFGIVDIKLHPQLTVLTGRNGAGKSTILNIFSSHFGYSRPFLATPFRVESGGYGYFTKLDNFLKKVLSTEDLRKDQVGDVDYTNNQKARVIAPEAGGIQYQLSIRGQQNVEGFHVSSHRRMPSYRAVQSIPTSPMLPQHASQHFNQEMSNQYSGQDHGGSSSTYRIKEALLSMAMFGPGNKYAQSNKVLTSAFDGFVAVLHKILPVEIGFMEISIRSPDVVLVTKSGEFLMDAASGGLMVLVDLAWQIYMFSLQTSSFVVTIDEPENHLHPSMQRSLMGNLIGAFPDVQFIVATHSPFIVSAVRDARVYVLRHEEQDRVIDGKTPVAQVRFVESVLLDSANRAGTASQILREVLGLPTTYPEWVTEGVKQITKKYQNRPFTDELLLELRDELSRAGYNDFYPDVISELVKS